MAPVPAATAIPAETSPRIECAQVHGGTRATSMPIALTGLDGFLYSRPCQSTVGGDIHYLSVCGSGLLARFCLADVVGHGADVAVVSEETHALLQKAVNWTDHRRVLRHLNRALASRGLESLTTAAMFTYFPPTRNLTYSYAGHPPAWHWCARRRAWSALAVTRDDRDGDGPSDLPLAVAANTDYSRGRLRAGVDDLIVVATDGVTDAVNEERRRFGENGLADTLRSIAEPTPRSVVETIVARIAEFCGRETFTHDDVTVLALRTRRVSKLAGVRSVLSNRLVRPFTRRAG
jgi:serine phosphatase RsbU (regulator of sigma subunit)